MDALKEVMNRILEFRDARDWSTFHSPRNLTAALAVEAAELQELLLWMTDAEATEHLNSAPGHREAEREIADVLIYALLFCCATDIDPLEAIRLKLTENAQKYPVDLARGRATKYSRLRPEDQQ